MLPPNSTEMERGLEGTARQLLDIPVPLATLWNPATIPAELPAPVWAGVFRKAGWNGLLAMNDLRSSPALAKHGALAETFLTAACRVPTEHSRTAK